MLHKIHPHTTVKKQAKETKSFYQALNNVVVYGGWILFGACLKWPLEEIQFLVL